MDVSRNKNTVKMLGNLEVKDQIKAQDLIVNGELIVNGKKIGSNDQQSHSNQCYIGDPNSDGSWKLELNNGELIFLQKNGEEWVPKQAMS